MDDGPNRKPPYPIFHSSTHIPTNVTATPHSTLCFAHRSHFSNLGIKVSFAEAGCEHTAAVDRDGGLWTWGQGDSGRLGHGDGGAGESLPKKVEMEEAKVRTELE
jgi:alpha-tubulin suppressor-like RCC1 family protein